MLSDLEIISHQFKKNDDLRIYPISDVHFGAAENMTREWEVFCMKLLEDKGAYIILDGCDCLVVGHTHKPFVTQPAKIKIDPFNNKVSIKPFKVVSMTSWLEWGGYAAQKMLPPTSHAPQIITLRGNKKEIRVEM